MGLKASHTTDNDGNLIDYSDLAEKVMYGLAYAGIKAVEYAGVLKEVAVENEENNTKSYTYKLADNLTDGKTFSAMKKALTNKVHKIEEAYSVDIPSEPVHTEAKDISIEDVRKRNESLTNVTETTAKAIISNNKIKWLPIVEVVNNILNIKPDALRALLGYSDSNNSDDTYEEQVSKEGKNRQIEADIENLMALKAKIDTGEADNGVYFDWFVARNGRQMIDAAGGFNPQAIKLHRYTVIADGQQGVVDSKKDPMSMTIFKLGIAQALGFKADKRPIAESITFADDVLEPKYLEEILNNIKEGRSEFTVNGRDIKIEELSHAMLALHEGSKYSPDKPFSTNMLFEIDGLTNGFGHKMMQFLATGDANIDTIDDNTIEWLRKVGLSFTKEDAQDIVDKIANGSIVDAYVTLGEQLAPNNNHLISSLRARLQNHFKEGKLTTFGKSIRSARFGKLQDDDKIMEAAEALINIMPNMRENGELQGFVRDLMKDPFMTFGYSAGFTSMSNSIASKFIDEVMHNIVNDTTGKYDKLLNALGVNTSDKARLYKEIKTKPYNSIILYDGRSLLESFRGLILGVYGDAVKDVVQKEFGGVIELNRAIIDSTNTMFDIFQAAYNTELKIRKINGVPSKEDHDEIMEILRKAGMLPVVKGPDSKGYEDGIAMYSTKTALAATNKFANARIMPIKGKGSGRSVKARRKALFNPKARGGVLLTHFTDALGTALKMLKDKGLQIFDAHLLGVNQAHVAYDVNKDFVETNMNPEWSQISTVSDGLDRIMVNAKAYFDNTKDEEGNVILPYKDMLDEVNNEQFNRQKERNGTDDTNTKEQPSVEDIQEHLHKLNESDQNRRKDLARRWFTAEQFVLSNKYAFEYDGIKVVKNSVKEELKGHVKENVDTVINNIATKLKDILSCAE